MFQCLIESTHMCLKFKWRRQRRTDREGGDGEKRAGEKKREGLKNEKLGNIENRRS